MAAITSPELADARAPGTAPAPFLLRRGGLPFDVADALRTPDLARWFDEEQVLAARHAAAREHLDEMLAGTVVPGTDGEARRRAVNLRRGVRSGKVPDVAAGTLADLLAVFPQLGPAVAGLAAAAHAEQDHLVRGEQVVAREHERLRADLAAVAGDPRLRHGIQLQSRDLDRLLEDLGAAGTPAKRVRRLERTLLTYVFRASAKTSPFSTLGVVAAGEIGQGEPGAAGEALVLRTGPVTVSGTQLNLGVVGRIIDIVSGSDRLLRDVPLALNASVQSRESRLRYVRRLRRAARSDAPVDMGQVSETVFYLGAEHVAAGVVSVFADGRRATSEQAGASLAALLDDDVPADLVTEYLHALLRVGFLVTPVLVIDIHSASPVRDFASRLADLDVPWATGTAAHLLRLDALATGYGTLDLDARRACDAAVREELGAIEDLLDAEGRLRALGTVVFEDVVDAAGTARVDAGWWEDEVAPVLHDHGRLLALYDPSGPTRLAMAAYFRARHGADGVETDVTTFLHEFGQDCFEQLQQAMLSHQDFTAEHAFRPLPNWFRLPTYDAIDAAKVRVRDHLQQVVDREGADRSRILLDPAWFHAEAGRAPSVGTHEEDPRSFFVQIARDGAAPLAVLNKSYCGMGLHVSRFARLLDDAGPAHVVPRVRAQNRDPDGRVVFAELRGGFDTTNLNLHPHLTDHELVCPGETSFRDPAEQIALESLQIRADGADGGVHLWSEELGARVVPVYLGFLLPFALPPMQQELLLFSAANMAMPDLWKGVDLGDGGHRPRLQVGRVVLRRESWLLPVDGLPDLPASAGPLERYRDWRRWQRAHGLPDQVFLQPRAGAAREGDDDAGAPAVAKPLYVDFTSEPSVRLLDHDVRRQSDQIELVEALPGPDQLWADERTGERYVTELTIDINPPAEVRPARGGRA